MQFAIVVIAYNRPVALARLLESLDAAQRTAAEATIDVPLVISIDYSDEEEVTEIAEEYEWRLGEKRVIKHGERLGLKRHVMLSGDLVEDFGNIVMLEDDLWVSPYLWSYVSSALALCQEDPRLGQVSLYGNVFNETAQLPFVPFDDGYDNYYMKVPSSWGQMWTLEQWRDFRRWMPEYELHQTAHEHKLPRNVRDWPETSWKKIFQSYLISQDKLVLYPRNSLTTNFADAGTHHVGGDFHFQSPLLSYRKSAYKFSSTSDSRAVYDEYSERTDAYFRSLLNTNFGFEKVVVDLYGARELEHYPNRCIITCRENLNGKTLAQFQSGLIPHELNITVRGKQAEGMYRLVKLSSAPCEDLNSPLPSVMAEQFFYYYGLPRRVFDHARHVLFPPSLIVTRKEALKILLPKWIRLLVRRTKNWRS